MNQFEQERNNPLAYRKVGRVKRAWKMWRFEAMSKKAAKKREREFQRLIRSK